MQDRNISPSKQLGINFDKETWRVVKEDPNYEVSSHGRVRSISRIDKRGYLRKQKMLKPYLNFGNSETPYHAIKLSSGRKTNLIHRLVATAFIPNPENKPFINHRDGNKLNNHVSNLEWVSASENLQHAYLSGIKKIYLGGKNWNSKRVNQYSLTGEFIKSYPSSREASIELGICRARISHACCGKAKTSGGYKWKYA